ncbi:MAG: Verru_Chthon cassette protein C [Chthoniobacteraceae bacterium]
MAEFFLEKRMFKRAAAFTLLELFISLGILVLILVVVSSVITQASSLWRNSTSRVEAFQSARTGFELLTSRLSQATLNTYLDYDNATTPTTYLRKSELAFVCGYSGTSGFPGTLGCGQAIFFQAPLGYVSDKTSYGHLGSLMNTCGYYVQYTVNNTIPPHVSPAANPSRYRLMQLMVPSESDTVYTATNNDWVTGFTNQSRPLADNVIALIIRQQDPGAVLPDIPDLSKDYTYDSRIAVSGTQQVTTNQLPPVIQVTMVAIDEPSAKRLEERHSDDISAALNGKFQLTSSYTGDLEDLESALRKAHIQYRIFSTAIPIRESKWTK